MGGSGFHSSVAGERMSQNRIALGVLSLLLYVTWIMISLQGNFVEGFESTYLLPLAFILVFFTLLWRPLFGGRGPFVITYTVVELFRFVVLSVVTVAAVADQGIGVFGRNVYSSDQLNTASFLMMYELLITSAAIYFLSNKKNRLSERTITCGFYTPFYIAVVIIALAAVAAVPSARSGLTLLLSFDEGDVSRLPTSILLVRELFVTAKYFLFFIAIKWVCKKHSDGKVVQNPTSVITLCLVSLLVIGIRIGTNRKRIIADAIACAVIIFLEFPKYRKQLAMFFVSAAFVLVASTSVFRGATESFGSLMGDLFEAGSLQSYLCGQYNIAAALETRETFASSIGLDTLLYSTFRSFFGIGTLISGMGIPTLSDFFNQVASANYTYLRASQIIPTVGEGAIYFGLFLAPLISLVVVCVGVQIDKWYQRTTKVEVLFILLVLAVYLGQGLVLTSNIIVNNVTFKLALFVPAVLLANYLFADRVKRRQ